MTTVAENGPHKSAVRVGLVTAFILLVPLVAMQFTDEVVWDPADFVVAGVLLFGAGVAFKLAARKAAGNVAFRAAVGVAVAASLGLVWMNLAVGIIGSENNAANLMYGLVLAVGFIGAFMVRLQPRGMVLTLLAMALSQVLVAVIAIIFGWGETSSNPLEFVLINGIFVALFCGSALLFQRAARERPKGDEGGVD
jgi:hypothetical protein